MAQFKVYGHAAALRPRRAAMSDVIHDSAVAVLGLPADKRFHRFFPLEDGDLVAPGRGADYTIVEVVLFAGRSPATLKAFVLDLVDRVEQRLGIAPLDLEIVLMEVPRHAWGIRGLPGDELTDLTYRVDI